MRKLRNIIRWFTPYGVVRWYARKYEKSNSEFGEFIPKHKVEKNFVSDFRRYLASDDKCSFLETSPYKTVVAVQGFGFSGSGAVVDLLREYKSTHVVGSVDTEGSMTDLNIDCEEVDILRLAGGLFEVEKYIGSYNIFQNDAMLHRVIMQIEMSDIYNAYPSSHPYFYEYMRQICEVLTNFPVQQYYNTYLNYEGNNDIFYLKELTVNKYREICRKLLNSLFSIIKQKSERPILVLDQFVSDYEFDYERYLQYVPNLKLIVVYRDPRDVYAFAKMKDIEWIPHMNAEVFVKWCQMMFKPFNIAETGTYYAIRFEELLDDYNNVVGSVENYIGLEASDHFKKGKHLAVSESLKNVGIWKNLGADELEMSLIENKLREYCTTSIK